MNIYELTDTEINELDNSTIDKLIYDCVPVTFDNLSFEQFVDMCGYDTECIDDMAMAKQDYIYRINEE